MDAIALLENIGLKVKFKGYVVGKVKSQSILFGQPIIRNWIILLEIR